MCKLSNLLSQAQIIHLNLQTLHVSTIFAQPSTFTEELCR